MTTENAKAVGQFLLTHQVNNLISNYKQQRWATNSEKMGKADTLNIWWSINEIEKFLLKAKENNADGVKFCFGVYDADENGTPGNQTIAMVATQQEATENGTVNKNVFTNTTYGKNIVAYNRGRIYPPPTDLDEITYDPYELGVTIIETKNKELLIM